MATSILPNIATRTSHVRAFTLIEVLASVAALVIVLGLMISLARDVRNRSADQLTKDLLRKLEQALHDYMADAGGALPQVEPFMPLAASSPAIDDADVPESELAKRAVANNRQFVLDFRRRSNLADRFGDLSLTYFDEVTLRDAWGGPIVFMPRMHPAIGMAPRDRPFFFSAGQDRRFLTRQDNLYSYEEAGTD